MTGSLKNYRKRLWNPERWNQSSGRANGTKEDAKLLNVYLENLCAKIYQAKTRMLENSKPITAETLKKVVTGQGDEKRLLLEIFQKHNDQMKELVGKEFAYTILQRYRTTFDHTKAFIKWKYGKEDLDINDLDYEFVEEYSFWLKSVKQCNHNSMSSPEIAVHKKNVSYGIQPRRVLR